MGCRLFVNKQLSEPLSVNYKSQWNLNIFIQGNMFENAVSKMAAIFNLLQLQWFKSKVARYSVIRNGYAINIYSKTKLSFKLLLVFWFCILDVVVMILLYVSTELNPIMFQWSWIFPNEVRYLQFISTGIDVPTSFHSTHEPVTLTTRCIITNPPILEELLIVILKH